MLQGHAATTKKLLKKQNFGKKGYPSVEKTIWFIFSRFIEYHKHQGPVCKGPQSKVIKIVQV